MEIVQFSTLSQYPELVHGVATADFGNMSFNWGRYDEVRANRKQFFDSLGVSEENVAVASLIHGNTIRGVTTAERGRGIIKPEESLEADILITAEPDTFLFMVVADCLALFLFEPEKQVCALAHAGWKGVEARVPETVVQVMADRFGCDRTKILVGMSPARQAASSRFPTEQVAQKQMPGWEPYLREVNNETEVDFVQYAYDQFVAVGVETDNIERSLADTKTDHRFFSHRRSIETNEPEARFGCLIGFTALG